MTKPRQNDKDDLPALTGVRFVAVSMVFLIHYNSYIIYGDVLGNIINQFYLSLHIFFVLSGFIICYKYYEKVRLEKTFLFSYFLKRFARVYPLYFILTTLTYTVYLLRGNHHSNLFGVYLMNITFLKGFSINLMFTGIFPSWSLTIEETFYFLSPVIFFLIRKRNIFYSQIFFFWTVGALLLLFFQRFPFQGLFADFHFVAFATFFGRCFEFYCGMWLAIYLIKNPQKINSSSKAIYTYVGFFFMVFVILLLAYISPSPNVSAVKGVGGLLISNLVFPIAVIVFFYGLVSERSFLKKLLSTRPFQLLGRSSYSFFLVHTGVIAGWVSSYITKDQIFFQYICMYIIAIILFKLVEHPLNIWIRNKGRNRNNTQYTN